MRTVAVESAPKNTRNACDEEGKTTRRGIDTFTPEQIETAQYIADMILELRNLAKGSGLFAAMIPLEYAYYEAFAVANRVAVPPEEAERLKRLGEQAARQAGSAA